MSKKKLLAVAAAPALAVSLLLGLSPAASAKVDEINGSTGWDSCEWATSDNIRSTTVANKQVRVSLHTVGRLGVKMRSKAEIGGAVSNAVYFPAEGFQNLSKYSKAGTQYRLQFACVNTRKGIFDRPSTNFSGSVDN